MKMDRQLAVGLYLELDKFLRTDDQELEFDSAQLPRYDIQALDKEVTQKRQELKQKEYRLIVKMPFNIGDSLVDEIAIQFRIYWSGYGGVNWEVNSVDRKDPVGKHMAELIKSKTIPVPDEVGKVIEAFDAELKEYFPKQAFRNILANKRTEDPLDI